MLITIDTSVLIAVISNEPSKASAVELTAGHALVAPHSVHWEIGNALSAMLKRQRINASQSTAFIAEYEQIPIRFLDVGLRPALAWTVEHRIYAYDAYVLECARQSNSALLTLDGALKQIAGAIGIEVLEV